MEQEVSTGCLVLVYPDILDAPHDTITSEGEEKAGLIKWFQLIDSYSDAFNHVSYF